MGGATGAAWRLDGVRPYERRRTVLAHAIGWLVANLQPRDLIPEARDLEDKIGLALGAAPQGVHHEQHDVHRQRGDERQPEGELEL